MFVQKLKHLIGAFNLTPFEEELINVLKGELPFELVKVLENQLSLFNKVDRVLSPAEELPFGHTSFYWVRFGKARMDYPMKFPTTKESETLATVEVYSVDDDNLINVSFGLVQGFLFTIKYRSKKKKFTPSSNYKIQNFKFCDGWAEYCAQRA